MTLVEETQEVQWCLENQVEPGTKWELSVLALKNVVLASQPSIQELQPTSIGLKII